MNLSEDDIRHLTELRKTLHANPELSGEEFKTAERIKAFLEDYRPTRIMDGLGKTGILAEYDSGNDGPVILFRSELDALPIQEINTFEYRSKTEGVSHKCGHDGHSAGLVGLARLLYMNPIQKGKVLLLFQPAEENGEGAIGVLREERFHSIQPDFVFAYHNLPGYEMNKVVLRKDAFTASVKSMVIKFKGKTAHAAEPENGMNPALAISDLLQLSFNISNNEPSRSDFKLITPVHVKMGELAYGISAGYGEVHLTIRTWTERIMGELEGELINIIDEVSINYGIDIEYHFTHEFSANENDSVAVDQIAEATVAAGFQFEYRDYPFKWGEDFGLFTQKFRGAMFGIGSGVNTPALHNPDYDFPDELIATGASIFYELCKQHCYE